MYQKIVFNGIIAYSLRLIFKPIAGKLLFLVLLLCVWNASQTFAQGIPTGPAAVRKLDSKELDAMRANPDMRGNAGISPGVPGRAPLAGAGLAYPVTNSCEVERDNIKALKELNIELTAAYEELKKRTPVAQKVTKGDQSK